MESLRQDYRALVVGSSGGIGAALVRCLEADMRCAGPDRLDRSVRPGFDLAHEPSIAAAAESLAESRGGFDLILDATGALEIAGTGPEKSLAAIDPAAMARQFAVNAIGPALLLKHFAPLLARDRKAVFATLSARVGSIGDNRLGGWISYRAAKAALNQIVRTAAIEIARKRPQAVCVALHPGTVATRLSAQYAGSHRTLSADEAARRLLLVVDGLEAGAAGGFFAHDGSRIPW